MVHLGVELNRGVENESSRNLSFGYIGVLLEYPLARRPSAFSPIVSVSTTRRDDLNSVESGVGSPRGTDGCFPTGCHRNPLSLLPDELVRSSAFAVKGPSPESFPFEIPNPDLDVEDDRNWVRLGSNGSGLAAKSLSKAGEGVCPSMGGRGSYDIATKDKELELLTPILRVQIFEMWT